MTQLMTPAIPLSQLGNSGLSVSKICLGTMTFGEQNTETEAHSQLDYALERGVNFIDTAEMYPVMPRSETQGRTEQYLGSWLKKSGKRQDVILATKVAGPSRGMGWIRNGENDLNAVNIPRADCHQFSWLLRRRWQASRSPRLLQVNPQIFTRKCSIAKVRFNGNPRRHQESPPTYANCLKYVKTKERQNL